VSPRAPAGAGGGGGEGPWPGGARRGPRAPPSRPPGGGPRDIRGVECRGHLAGANPGPASPRYPRREGEEGQGGKGAPHGSRSRGRPVPGGSIGASRAQAPPSMGGRAAPGEQRRGGRTRRPPGVRQSGCGTAPPCAIAGPSRGQLQATGAPAAHSRARSLGVDRAAARENFAMGGVLCCGGGTRGEGAPPPDLVLTARRRCPGKPRGGACAGLCAAFSGYDPRYDA